MKTDKKNIEDQAIVTDIHELVKREVECQHKPFMTAYFMGEERLNRKQNEILTIVKRVAPGRTIVIVDNILTKAAIVILFLLVIFGFIQ